MLQKLQGLSIFAVNRERVLSDSVCASIQQNDRRFFE